MNAVPRSWLFILAVGIISANIGCKRTVSHPYANLDATKLLGLPDTNVQEAILDYVESKIPDYAHEYEAVTNLPKGFQVIYATTVAEGEIDNGGFNQFFWNSSGKFAQEAAEGFKLVGAPGHAVIMQEAITIYKQNQQKLDGFKQQATIEAFSKSYKDNPLNALDHRFYKLEGNLEALRIKFVREHPELFFGR